MNIAICDDELQSINTIKNKLEKYALQTGKDFCIKTFSVSVDFLEIVSVQNFDVIFLDVAMPEINGFELAEIIRRDDTNVQIVFVTNMEDDIKKAFSVMAAGFVVKPAKDGEIELIMEKLVKIYEQKRILPYPISEKGGSKGFIVLQNVFYFESMNHYIRVKMKNKIPDHIYLGNIADEIIKLSQYGFVQIHRSYIVNMEHIWIVKNRKITFTNREELTIGETFTKSFKKIYWDYKKGGVIQ